MRKNTARLSALVSAVVALSVIVAPSILPAFAEDNSAPVKSDKKDKSEILAKLLALQVEAGSGHLIFQAEQAVLHPVFELAQPDASHYQLVIHFSKTDSQSLNSDTHEIVAQLKSLYPAIQNLALNSDSARQETTLVLTGSSSFQPKQLSNSGSLLTISLWDVPSQAQERSVTVQVASTSGGSQSNLSAIVSDADLMKSSKTDGIVREAWSDIQQGNIFNAISDLKNYLSKIPNDSIAQYVLAVACFSSGNADELQNAQKLLNSAISNSSRFPLAELESCHQRLVAILQGSLFLGVQVQDSAYKELVATLTRLESQFPNQPNVLYERAMLELYAGHADVAKTYFAKLNGTSDFNSATYEHDADLALGQKNIPLATALYQRALSLSFSPGRLSQKLMTLYQQQGNNDKALYYAGRVLTPDYLIAYARLLQQHQQNEDSLSVLKLAELSLQDNQNPLMSSEAKRQALFQLGLLYRDLNQAKLAQTALTRFVVLASENRGSSKTTVQDAHLSEATEVLKSLAARQAQTASCCSVKPEIAPPNPSSEKPPTEEPPAEKPATEKAP